MKTRLLISLVFLVALLATATGPVQADGIIIPQPPICDHEPCPGPFPIAQLAIVYHRVDVSIEDQVAITHVDQVFRNDQDWDIEGTYVFPLPPEASVTNFTLWVNGEAVEAEILDRDQARATYEEIVRQLIDPALLEYVGRGAVKASIFPIPAGGTRRIELEYTQVLTADSGLIHYSYPLNTEKFSTQPLEEVTVNIDIRSSDPLRAVYSPSHTIAVDRISDHHIRSGYEAYDITPDTDFELYYSLTDQAIGVNLISYRDPQATDEDGFFMLLAAPGIDIDPEEREAQDIIFVLDQSGSMDGENFLQAQDALHYVLDHLGPADRFNIVSFSTGVHTFAATLQSIDSVEDGHDWVDRLAPMGSTDINRALLETLSMTDDQRSTTVIFLTDGLPTEGVVNVPDIIRNVKNAAGNNIHLFVFGIGYDVDTILLDTLARDHHGSSTYVTPGQAIDETISAFYAKVSTPILTDIQFEFSGQTLYDLHPSPLPDLFAGGQLILVGRYKDSGEGTIRLSGQLQNQTTTFRYEDQRLLASGGPDFLPRLWATRKIGTLLEQLRLDETNQEAIDQVVSLSIRYGIITPYTSFLVTEPDVFGEEAHDSISENFLDEILGAVTAPSGKEAVERADAEGAIREADVPVQITGSDADTVRIVGASTFQYREGIWMDTRFDPDRHETTRVAFLSDDYFELVRSYPKTGAALALGERVIVMIGDRAIEIVAAGETGDRLDFSDLEIYPSDSSSDSSSDSAEPAGSAGICASLLILPIALMALPWITTRTAR